MRGFVANCPKCGKRLNYMKETDVSLDFMGPKVAAYTCPDCDSVIGFPADADDIARRVVALLERPKRR